MNKTLKNGIAKVPVVMQLEAQECGAAVLSMILSYYGRWLPLETLREECGVSRDGTNAKNILRVAALHGLAGEAKMPEDRNEIRTAELPCILSWKGKRYVVLCGFRKDKVVINDPEEGTIRVSLDEFRENWTGEVITLRKTKDFTPGGAPLSMLQFAEKRLARSKRDFGILIGVAAGAAVFSVAEPVLTQNFIDRYLESGTKLTGPFLVAFFALLLVQSILLFFEGVYTIRVNGRLAVESSTAFMWKLMRLPISFYETHYAGDLENRKNANSLITGTVSQVLSPSVVWLCMAVAYFITMLTYDVKLSLLGLVSVLINVVSSRFVSGDRLNEARSIKRIESNLMNETFTGVEMIETIKSNGAENGFFDRWAGYHADYYNDITEYRLKNTMTSFIPEFITTVTNTVILVLGAGFVMQGKMTIGIVMAFQSLYGQFATPARNLASAGQTFREMRSDAERIADVMDYPVDGMFFDDEETDLKRPAESKRAKGQPRPDGRNEESGTDGRNGESGPAKTERRTGDAETQEPGGENTNGRLNVQLSGKIEVKNITFGYGKLSEPLFSDISFTVNPGESIAIVGTSGCGKSTFSKLLTGLYRPWKGEILYDGRPIDAYDRAAFAASVSVVDQSIVLFADTIANNVRMWDRTIEDYQIILACRDAGIHESILNRKNTYSTVLEENGHDLSGGQRQSLEIARTLALDAPIMILDEATSALDAVTEKKVVRSIRNRGITTICIAHRLSTIRDCDRIYVLDGGKFVCSGTHDELMEQSELYRELIVRE